MQYLCFSDGIGAEIVGSLLNGLHVPLIIREDNLKATGIKTVGQRHGRVSGAFQCLHLYETVHEVSGSAGDWFYRNVRHAPKCYS